MWDKAQAKAQVGLVVVIHSRIVDNDIPMEVRAYSRLLEGGRDSASEVLGGFLDTTPSIHGRSKR